MNWKKHFKINKSCGIPIYVQIKDKMKELIHEGMWEVGEKLPTEREFAAELGVSRNTVSMAYQVLQEEGYLVIDQGRGSFINQVTGFTRKNYLQDIGYSKKEKALHLIDVTIEECLDLGFSLQQIIAWMTLRVREKEESLEKAAVLFIDCNEEQLANFTRQFREMVHLQIIPILLKKFSENGMDIRNLVNQIDLVVTTTTHLEEVSHNLEKLGSKVEVIAVSAQPKMESLIQLLRMAGHDNIGLVCFGDDFPQIVKRSLEKLGFPDIQIAYTTTNRREELESFIEKHQVILAFRERFKEVKAIAGDKVVISYLHELDPGSVNLVRRMVDRIMEEKTKGEPK